MIKELENFKLPKKGYKIWRYMSIEKLKDLLQNNALYFASANEFEDTFEGSITKTHYKYNLKVFGNDFYKENIEPAFRELKRLTKINCWHINDHESHAMRKLYLQDNKGVAVQSTTKKLTKAIKTYKIRDEFCNETINYGKIKYIDYKNEIMNDKSMLGRFYYKRKSYSYEKELRLTISLRNAEEFGTEIPEKGIKVNIDKNKLIQAIYIAPYLNKEDENKIRTLVEEYMPDTKIIKSELESEALY